MSNTFDTSHTLERIDTSHTFDRHFAHPLSTLRTPGVLIQPSDSISCRFFFSRNTSFNTIKTHSFDPFALFSFLLEQLSHGKIGIGKGQASV
ncbi:hypothetical protein [Rhodopirellula bahusiensis]|uniref:hypothetical protein n=1 Tax=Rhodopirellula bahusiensis TaxID=2014065 RepID=UPI003265FCE2